jgi:hypothetical protein
MYVVGVDGNVRWQKDFRNSWRGAMLVWDKTADMLGVDKTWGFTASCPPYLKRVWAIVNDLSQPIALRAVVMATFDNVMVKRENLERLANYIEEWAKTVDDSGHLLEQGAELRSLAIDDDIRAVCWNATSVNCDPWWVYETDDDDDEGRPYNVDRDTKHWFLFDELKE